MLFFHFLFKCYGKIEEEIDNISFFITYNRARGCNMTQNDKYNVISTLLSHSQPFFHRYDLILLRHRLFDFFHVAYQEIPIQIFFTMNEIKEKFFFEKEQKYQELLGIITPSASHVIHEFYSLKEHGGDQVAFDYLVRLHQYNQYLNDVKRIEWKFHDVEIVINESKKRNFSSSYTACVLCIENMGNVETHKANLRPIPVRLGKEEWFLQLSPIAYFDYHCILISEKHQEKRIDNKTFLLIQEIIQMFPTAFVGVNAPAPVVGGSILEHEHYHLGFSTMPIFQTQVLEIFENKYFPHCAIEVLSWPILTIRVIGEAKEVVAVANHIYQNFLQYDGKEFKSDYNTATVVGHQEEKGLAIYLTFRNYERTKELPYGKFHTKEENHWIKKSGIGVIEVMGKFIIGGNYEELKATTKKDDETFRQIIGMKSYEILRQCNIMNQDELQKFLTLLNLIPCRKKPEM